MCRRGRNTRSQVEVQVVDLQVRSDRPAQRQRAAVQVDHAALHVAVHAGVELEPARGGCRHAAVAEHGVAGRIEPASRACQRVGVNVPGQRDFGRVGTLVDYDVFEDLRPPGRRRDDYVVRAVECDRAGALGPVQRAGRGEGHATLEDEGAACTVVDGVNSSIVLKCHSTGKRSRS